MAEQHLKTLVRFFLDRVDERGEQTALREKDYGIWLSVSWDQYLDHVKHFGLGLRALGFERGDHLAILSENCRQWLYAELGAICMGGVSLGVYPTSPYPEVHYVVKHSDSVFVMAEDQEQTDKILEVIDDLPMLKKIIVKDMKGLRRYPKDHIMSFAQVEELGRELDAKEPELFMDEVAMGDPDDVCIMVYTSGTTGKPKGAMLSHRNVAATAEATAEAIEATPDDEVVSYLPLCHVAEKIFSLFLPMHLGYTVNFAESIATIQSDLREIAPTVFLGVPRIWEKLQSSIQINIKDSSRLKQFMFKRFLVLGYRLADIRAQDGRTGLIDKLYWQVAYWLMMRALQNFVGLRNARFSFSAAAPISPEVLRFFHALGVRVKEGYGMTETTGLSFIHMGDDIVVGTVGKPISCIDFRIADDGELLKGGDAVFVGYYKNEAATAECMKDGWLHTGDVAEVDDRGHLSIVDRKKDLIITSGGKNIAPSEIENALKVSPYIKEAIVIGDGRKFISALIQIDFENVGKWATDNRIPYTTFKNLSEMERIFDLIKKDVDKVNETFARVENVRKFVLLTKELDHDDDEMTATMKVRRSNIHDKFAQEIESIYSR